MQAIKQNVIVLSVNRYQMVDQSTGDVNEGTTVRFLYSDNLNPVQEPDVKGHRPGKASLPYNDFERFPEAPALYSCDLTIKVASDGKAQTVASNFEMVKSFAPSGK